MLNCLLHAKDLAELNQTQKQFIVERIDHLIDNDEQIRKIIASKLDKDVLPIIAPKARAKSANQIKGGGCND